MLGTHGRYAMQEYTFVSIAMIRQREGASYARDYREVITKHVALGWKFVQAIPFEHLAEPRLDLVFTRRLKEKVKK